MWLDTILLCVCLLCSILPASAQSSLIRDLSFSLPLVIVFIIIVVIFIVVVYMLYRAKRGYFCCLKPEYRLPPSARARAEEEQATEEREREEDTAVTSALPPSYQQGAQQRPVNIAPPDYRDALQDQIITQPVQSPTFFQPEVPATTESDAQETTPPPPPPATTEEPPPPAVEEEVDLVVPTDEPDLEDSVENCDDTTPLNP